MTGPAQATRGLLPFDFAQSAEFAWLRKPVLASRTLDDMTRPDAWRSSGTASVTFPTEPRPDNMRVLRVDMQMFRDAPAPTRNRLSSVNLRRAFHGEDWRAYNRLSLWIKPEVRGFPMPPLQIVLHNDDATQVPDKYYREGIHYVTLENNKWTQVVWEIEPLARDRVTAIEIGYWVNKMLALPGDTVAFKIDRIELQQVTADNHTGWSVTPNKFAHSHSGYLPHSRKSVIVSAPEATHFSIVRFDDDIATLPVPRKTVRTVRSRIGEFEALQATVGRRVAAQSEFLRTHSILETLELMNSDSAVARDVAEYFALVPYGEPWEYAGPDLLASWYQRNIRIYHNINRLVDSPNERILVIYGGGHLGWLRQNVASDATVTLRKLSDFTGDPLGS